MSEAAEESDAAEEFSLCEKPVGVSDAAEDSEGGCKLPREAASCDARRRRKEGTCELTDKKRGALTKQ